MRTKAISLAVSTTFITSLLGLTGSVHASEIDNRLIHEISVNMKSPTVGKVAAKDGGGMAEYIYYHYRSVLNQAADEAGIESALDWVEQVLALDKKQTRWIRPQRKSLKHCIGLSALRKIETELPRVQTVALPQGYPVEYRFGSMIDFSLGTN